MSDNTLDKPKTPIYEDEELWVEMQPFLLAQGYQLRARYQPDWIPSWTVRTSLSREYEDRIAVFDKSVLDATRIRDGKKVVLKRVEPHGKEMGIIKYLASPSVRKDPRNRTIPLLDILTAPNVSWSFLVMPYCREFDYPPFHCMNEFMEAMTQFLEGLQFMHEHNIAHFDIAPQNMVMDESRVIPNGSHFAQPDTHTGFYGLFSWNNRCTVSPVQYFYIDFGLSLYYPQGKDTAETCGSLRTFPTIPELSDTVPYNPFTVDIFQLGLTIRKLINTYPDLEDFRPVADAMTATNPKDRPTPQASLAHLRDIASAIEPSKLSAQMWEKNTSLWKKVCRAVLGGYRYDYVHLRPTVESVGK
ncbi:kinase-like domain-containing protein [Mycena capillaripes]|nr:kinase-like domain-containing protein [Mycena capillaripes]